MATVRNNHARGDGWLARLFGLLTRSRRGRHRRPWLTGEPAPPQRERERDQRKRRGKQCEQQQSETAREPPTSAMISSVACLWIWRKKSMRVRQHQACAINAGPQGWLRAETGLGMGTHARMARMRGPTRDMARPPQSHTSMGCTPSLGSHARQVFLEIVVLVCLVPGSQLV